VKTYIYELESEKYATLLPKVVKSLSKDKYVIYVTTNKPCSLLIPLLKKSGVNSNNFFYIDCISKQVGADCKYSNAIFLDGPQWLTLISISITEAIKHSSGEAIIFFDSISQLLNYNNPLSVIKFWTFVINKAKLSNVDLVILDNDLGSTKDVVKNLQSFVDEVKKL